MKHYLFYFSIIGVYLLSWMIQDHLFLNWDVGHLLNSTKLLLAGGSYSEDFFIPNPPGILHLYLPPVLLQQFFDINVMLGFRVYIYCLITLSLFFCYLFLKQLFDKNDNLLFFIFFSTLCIGFLCLPLYEFGQRDHLLIIFMMPYLLAVAYQLGQVHSSFSRGWYVIIGLFASLGLVIKPQFMLTLFMIEAYYLFRKRSLLGVLRPELIIMIVFISIYHLLCAMLYADYFFMIVPYLLKSYYQVIGEPWIDLLTNPMMLFFYLVIGLHFTTKQKNPYKNLNTILLLSMISFILSYLWQRTTFYYHLVPAFSVALLLLTNIFTNMVYKKTLSGTRYLLVGLTAWASFVFLLYPIKNILAFLGFFILMSMLVFFLAHQDYRKPLKLFSLSLLASLLFGFPCKILANIYWYNLEYKNHVLDKLIALVKPYPRHQRILSLSMRGSFNSPLTYYTDAIIAERFDSLWMTGLLAKEITLHGEKRVRDYIKHNKDKYFFVNLIVEDIKKYQPNFIFIDDTHPNVRFLANNNTLQRKYFDFVSYFNENPSFHQAWQHYQYLTTISNHHAAYPCNIRVYQRETRKREIT